MPQSTIIIIIIRDPNQTYFIKVGVSNTQKQSEKEEDFMYNYGPLLPQKNKQNKNLKKDFVKQTAWSPKSNS